MSKYLEKFAQHRTQDSGEAIAQELLSAVQRERMTNLEKYAELEGEVMVHSMASTVLFYKEAAAKGLCWECAERVPSAQSVYGRCRACEANDV